MKVLVVGGAGSSWWKARVVRGWAPVHDALEAMVAHAGAREQRGRA